MPDKLKHFAGTAKLALIGAAGLLLSAGLCGIGSRNHQEFGAVGLWGFLGLLVSSVFLFGVAIAALVEFLKSKRVTSDDRGRPTPPPPSNKEEDD